jgi:hypothetical protein
MHCACQRVATVFTLAVCCATAYIAPATNDGYKDAHYYPYNRGSTASLRTPKSLCHSPLNTALLREKSLAL